ncbi:MAG TPA: DUF4232 domain-containing protein [Enteractinococcus helveticum]|uniref:DUF4232 domain-containing protein n=1 Tax=Enteractinococcus helveticum TaxID=1837282 RepID=A0A921K8D3_9MICC|nr:DUF4232 domain-containing protein [Enteractinococcus helveticum]HJF13809.1 DUF4232 domain-containing protein [Enteractinococcus helveticum]
MGRTTQRQLCGVISSTLILAALIVLGSVALQSQGLSSPWEIDPTHHLAVHSLNSLYRWLAGSALVVGLLGIFALIAGRPPQWSRFTGRSHGRARLLWVGALAIGIVITMWLPWWAFIKWSAFITGPSMTLLFFASAAAVQLTLWWWIRRQTGQDQEAWGSALAIQLIAFAVTLSVVMITFLFIVDTPAADNGFVLLMLPVTHPIALFLGTVTITRTLDLEPTAHNDDAHNRPASKLQRTATITSIVLIALTAIWAAWPRYLPGDIKQSGSEHHPAPGSETPSNAPAQSPSTPPATSEPTLDPTQAAPACDASALDVTIGGWDAATGARAAGIIVTNDDAGACQLQGMPELRIMQAGQDLEVNVREYELFEDGQETYETITIGPGQSAQAIVYWRGERGAHHDDSAQQVEVMVNGSWLDAAFEFHEHMQPMESPFDVVDGSELEIGQWSLL